MATFIPGYLATVTINSDDITAIGSVFRLNMSRNVINKPHFGNAFNDKISGKRNIAFSASGNISVEQAADLQAMFDSDAPIAFSLQVGAASGATDAGLYSGTCIVATYSIDVSGDGDFAWTIDAEASGTVTYTPAGS